MAVTPFIAWQWLPEFSYDRHSSHHDYKNDKNKQSCKKDEA
tara:strand:+ start:107 stop:229 length:123 start_codon:yes stop_codon:yes gene_type:complete